MGNMKALLQPADCDLKGNPKRKTVSLTLTHNCNLQCIYCYKGYKNSAIMPLEMAITALQRHFLQEDDPAEVEIDFSNCEIIGEVKPIVPASVPSGQTRWALSR